MIFTYPIPPHEGIELRTALALAAPAHNGNPGGTIKPPNPPEKPFDPPPNPPEKPLFMIIPPSVKKCLNNISEIRSYRLSIRYP